MDQGCSCLMKLRNKIFVMLQTYRLYFNTTMTTLYIHTCTCRGGKVQLKRRRLRSESSEEINQMGADIYWYRSSLSVKDFVATVTFIIGESQISVPRRDVLIIQIVRQTHPLQNTFWFWFSLILQPKFKSIKLCCEKINLASQASVMVSHHALCCRTDHNICADTWGCAAVRQLLSILSLYQMLKFRCSL